MFGLFNRKICEFWIYKNNFMTTVKPKPVYSRPNLKKNFRVRAVDEKTKQIAENMSLQYFVISVTRLHFIFV